MRRWPLRLLISPLSFALAGGVAVAQIPVSGYVKFYHHNRLEGDHGISRTGTRLQLTLQQSLSERAGFFGSVDFDVDDVRGRGDFFTKRGVSVEVYPVEMYVALYWPRLDLRLGKQFIFWGKTEWINPTDNINPWDYANISAEIEDYRLPVNGVRADLYVGNATLEGVYVPVFTPHRIPGLTYHYVAIPGQPRLSWSEPTLPETSLKNGQVAFRFLENTAGIDWSLSYYQGFDHSPSTSFYLGFWEGRLHSISFLPVYKRIHVYGADFQKVFGSWGFRGESAYFQTADRDGKDIGVVNPHFQGVLAFDYTPTNRLALALQWVQEVKFKYDPAYEVERRREMMMLPESEPRRPTSFSTRFRWQPGDYYSAQLIGVWNCDTKDRFVLAFVNYQPADAVNVTVGGVFFGGKPNTRFGRMADQDRIFLEVKTSF